MTKKLIELSCISKSFKKQTVFSDVTCCFESGKIYGLIGENGCGKTVLLKLICGFLYPTSGSVTINGKTIGEDIDFPENTGILIETPGFLPYYSGFKNLQFLAQIKQCVSDKEIASTMMKVGLNPQIKKRVSKYSLGMIQRLAFAQAIMEKPNLLVLDEIFNSLDHAGIEIVKKVLQEFKSENRAVLITSHNRYIIDEICDEVYELNDGKLIAI